LKCNFKLDLSNPFAIQLEGQIIHVF